MLEAIIATLLFWCTFVFSAGAFWSTIMQVATYSSFRYIYKHYFLYLVLGWLPIIACIGLVVGTLGGFNPDLINALYFVGAGVITYMAWKIVRAQHGKSAQLDFNWRAMSLLSWTNPKVWLVIPPGYLAATYSDSLWLNIAIFYALGVPLFLFGLYFWGMIGRQGAKIAKDKISYCNAALLLLFALYLLYQGVQQLGA